MSNFKLLNRSAGRAAIAALGLVATAAVVPAVSADTDPLHPSVDVVEETPTSIPAHEVMGAPAHARVALLDGVLFTEGITADGVGECVTAVSAIGPAGASTEAQASVDAVLSDLDCTVTTFILDVSADGSLTGLAATSDPAAVDRLSAVLGKGVHVELDFAGQSPAKG